MLINHKGKKLKNTSVSIIAIMLALVVFIIPDSKATTFMHNSTVFGTFSVDKALVLMSIILSIYIFIIKKYAKLKISPFLICIYLFMTWNIFLTMLSLFTTETALFNVLVFYLIMGYFVYFIVYFLSYNFEQFKISFIHASLFFATIDALIALYQSINQDPMFMKDYLLPTVTRGFWIGNGLLFRSWGLQGEPQEVGTLMSIALIMLISSYIKNSEKWSKKKKILSLLMGSLFIAASISSFSRASWIALIIALIYLKLKSNIRLFTHFRWIITGLFILAIVYVIRKFNIWDLMFKRVLELGSSDSFTHRMGIINQVSEIMNEYGITSILGLGPGAGVTIAKNYGALDNQFICLLFDSGIIGFIIFYSLSLKLMFSKTDITIRACIIVLFINMISYELISYSSAGTLYFILLGLASIDNIKLKEQNKTYYSNTDQLALNKIL